MTARESRRGTGSIASRTETAASPSRTREALAAYRQECTLGRSCRAAYRRVAYKVRLSHASTSGDFFREKLESQVPFAKHSSGM